jgi:hypothetical protein
MVGGSRVTRYQIVVSVDASDGFSARTLAQRLVGASHTQSGVTVEGWQLGEFTGDGKLTVLAGDVAEGAQPHQRDPALVLPPSMKRRGRR